MSTQDENFPLLRWKNRRKMASNNETYEAVVLQIGRRKTVDRKPYGADIYIIWEDVPTVDEDAPDKERTGGKTGKPQTVGH